MNFKHALNAGVVAAVLVLGTTAAHADTMTFDGTTSGKFANGTATDQTLTYNSGSFNGTTSDSGFVAFGGGGSNFGTFTLNAGDAMFNNDPFSLTITFTDPAGIQGGQNSTFSALVTGSVTAPVNGGANVNFNPNSSVYTFSNGVNSGTFTLTLNNVAVFAGQTASVTGYIQTNVAATPEPNSLMLLGTGFVSAAGMLMRRRKLMTA